MGCIEINYKKYHIKITNGETESDVWTHSDSELLYQFITYGILPEGYTLESNLNIQSKNDIVKVFQAMIEEIEENTSNAQLLRQILMSPELINKMAGNRDWGVNMYDRYEQDYRNKLQHNCFYISGWGSKSWYGFTNKRPFKITGWASSVPNIIDDTLLKSYYSLLDGNKFVRKTIEKLYKKYNSEGLAEDVYAKMTWLANNQLKNLISALYIPRNIWTGTNGLKIDNPEQIKGLGVKYKDQMYILTGKGNDDEFEAMKVSLTEDTIIKIKKSDITGLYQSFTVTDSSGEYLILNKIWYKLEKGNYVRVDDPTISNGLFDKWFGLVDDYEFETIDTSSKELNVTLEHQTENGTLGEVLPIGSYVRTVTGYFTKGFDGIFRNGDKILSEKEKIYKIFFKNIKDNQSYEEKAEIAKRVYNAQIIWGHPGIGKTHFFNTGIQEVIDFDSVYKPRINKELGIPEGEIERKKWRKNNKEKYKNKILELFNEAVLEVKLTGKKLLVSDMIVLEKREDVLDIITQMSEENFAHRSEKRDEPYDENRKLWKQGIDEAMSNVQDKSKIVFSNDYFSDIYFLGKSLSEQDNDESVEIQEDNMSISSKTPIEIVKASIPYEEDFYMLSKQDAIIILSEYGIDDFSNVWFGYDSDNIAEILQNGSGESRKTILKINLNNIEQNSDNIRKLKLAVNFFKMMSELQTLPPQLISNAHEIFEYLVIGDFSIDEIEVKKGENFTLDPNLKAILKNHFSKVEYKNDEWISILSENRDAFVVWNNDIEAEIDEKIKQAEKDNNIIRMCSL